MKKHARADLKRLLYTLGIRSAKPTWTDISFNLMRGFDEQYGNGGNTNEILGSYVRTYLAKEKSVDEL